MKKSQIDKKFAVYCEMRNILLDYMKQTKGGSMGIRFLYIYLRWQVTCWCKKSTEKIREELFSLKKRVREL